MMKKNKKILIVIGAIVFAIGVALGIFLGLANRVYRIAIYDLPETLSSGIKKQAEGSGIKIDVSVIDGKKQFSVSESKKYDAVITWNGAFAKSLSKLAPEIPANVYSVMPTSVRSSGMIDGKYKAVPILYDHVPIFICKSAAKNIDEDVGFASLSELESFMENAGEDFSFSMISAGSIDEYLYEFLSMMAESILGGEGYKKLCDAICEKREFREVLDDELAKSSDGKKLSLRTVMDKIFEWQSKSLIQRQWYTITQDDLFNLMQYKSFLVGSMPMDYYRNMPRRVSYSYSVFKFPPLDPDMKHGMVSNEVVMIPRSNKKPLLNLEKHLVSLNIQERLSNVTTYTVVHSQSGCFDSIADDARFFAASTPLGPLQMLDKAAFTSAETAKKFADDVREYLVNGI